MDETIDRTTENSFKKYIPIVTAICGLISIILCIGINLEGKIDSWDIYKKWGAPSVTDLFSGAWWGLITSNFLHIEIWHIAFNLYWLWIFGKKIEYNTSKIFYVVLILSSALVSSLAQISFSDTTGIGLSGIVYALFGYLYVRSKTTDQYKSSLEKKTINLFLFWLVFCVILTKTGAWSVGNAAHIGGLLWGALLAYLLKYEKYVQWSAAISYITILIVLIFYSPFSTAYLTYQAYELHSNERVDEAIVVYKKILGRDPENEFAKENLKLLELHKLEEKALDLHTNQNFREARKLYHQILSIDKDNQWAKENLSRLPFD